MIRYELFNPDSHFKTISDWWEKQKWSVVPLSHLPQIGVVVYSHDKMACAAWIYRTDSAFCILDWIVANPEIRKNERTESLNYLIEISKQIIKDLGFQSIFTVTRHSSLVSRFVKQSFSVSSENMASLIYNVNQGGS